MEASNENTKPTTLHDLATGKDLQIDNGRFSRLNCQPLDTVSTHPSIKDLIDNTIDKSADNIIQNVRAFLPIDKNWEHNQKLLIDEARKRKKDTINIGEFIVKGFGEPPISGASPDAQVLLAALLIEKAIEYRQGTALPNTNLESDQRTNPDRQVYIMRDPKDNHAIAVYKSRDHGFMRFDPTSGDRKFVKLDPK